MTEIEKAREALARQTYWADLGEFSQAEAEADAIIKVARAIAREEIEAALGIDAFPSPATPSLTGDPDLDARLKKSIRWFNSLSAKQQEEHLRKQRESWVRGEMGLGPDNKRATINQEGGDRNQLDRRQDREDKSPPAVEAPAACDPKEMAGRLRNIARDPNNFIPRAGSLIEAAVMIEDTTALARRLAEVSEWGSAVLKNIIASDDVVGQAVIRLIEDALAEARKHKLIE